MKKKLLALLLAMVLILSVAVGTTVAFLVAKTEPITNTFVLGDFTYKLSLDANAPAQRGSEVVMPTLAPGAEQTVAAPSAVFTASGTPTLVGYTFDGWHYDVNGSEDYADISGNNITVNYGDTHDKAPAANEVSIELFAHWVANNYQVVYNGNGNTSGNMANSNHVYDVASNLSKNAYTKTGYAFVGWNTDPNATEAEFIDEEEVINLTAEDNGVVTLYAVWSQMEYKVSFDTQTPDVQNPADMPVTYDECYGTLPAVTRTGYIFNGWSLDQAGTQSVTAETIVKTAGDHTLYAQWTPITYTVVYDRNGDDNAGITGSTASSTHTYDVAKNLTTNGYERTGYTFIGWNTQADGKGSSYADAESVVNLTSVPDGTVTLYAQWGAKSYVIRYHANTGEGSMGDQTIKYDEPTNLNKNQFTKDDHSFMGWALTPDGEVKYIDEQTVVNLLESGTLDLYAVWAQDSHTVHFDYNGGSGSPASKQFQYGKPYGQLPEYPVHPTKVISEKEVMSYLFTGWYTAPTGGTRVYPTDIANTKEDHTLYAHWEEAPTNNVIKDIVVKNNPDDDNDGVVDDVYLNLKCSSSFEKFNIPLKNLVPGQTYRITYNASNDASFGDHISGYQSSVYGSYIVATKELTGGRIDAANSTVPYYGKDILSTWNDRIEPDGNNDGSQAAINDSYLQGPWKNRTITFTATQTTMYWAWDFGLMQDGILDNYNITDIVLEPVVPKIEFANKELIIYNTSMAQVLNDNSSAYATNFVFDGDGYAETMYFPITGLKAGTTYTIVFDHKMTGALINNTSYNYGCGISSTVPTAYGSYMDGIGATWISGTKVFTNLNSVESVTFTFTATSDKAYWVWNMANCSDSTNCTIDVKITNFSATHSEGGSITYHTAASAVTP